MSSAVVIPRVHRFHHSRPPDMDEERDESVFCILFNDIISFILMGLITYVLFSAEPTKRGFFCNDESIRYPEIPATVPTPLMYGVGLSLTIFSILFGECLREQKNGEKRFPHQLGRYWNMYRIFASYASGLWVCQTTVQIGKLVIGRLRPYFLDACRPVDLESLCSNPNNVLYIEHIHCSRSDSAKSRLSFPSGHSSFSFYCAVFLVLYLQKTLKLKSNVVKPSLQFVLVALAWYVSLSRVMDYKHHWGDVLVGMIIGSTVAVFITIFVLPKFEDSDTKKLPSRYASLLNSKDNVSSALNEKQIVPLLVQ